MHSSTRSLPDADAIHYLALQSAEGVNVPQNWVTALDQLQRAAELGSTLAQAELTGLSGNWTLAHAILAGEPPTRFWRSHFRPYLDPRGWLKPPQSQWSRLRSSIDLARWLTAPYQSATISEAPRMVILKDLAAPEICDWLIARAAPRLERAKVYDPESENLALRLTNERTNSDCAFSGPNRDLFMAILRARIAEATQMGIGEMEPPEVLHYSVGQEFHRHYDSPADPNTPGFRQRTITLLLSLNEDYEGGETEFPLAGGRWRGRKGTAIYFWNVLPDGTRDKRSLHAGLPITRGEKWLMTQFIDRPRSAPQ